MTGQNDENDTYLYRRIHTNIVIKERFEMREPISESAKEEIVRLWLAGMQRDRIAASLALGAWNCLECNFRTEIAARYSQCRSVENAGERVKESEYYRSPVC